MGDEMTKEKLENMSQKEFIELMGKGTVKVGHIRTDGLNLQPQFAREKVREMARTGELDEKRRVDPIVKPHRNKYGLGYSMDEEDVEESSLLFSRRKK